MSERRPDFFRVAVLLLIGVPSVVALAMTPSLRMSFIPLVLPLALSFAAMELAPLPLPRGEQFRLDAGVAIAAMLLLDPLSAALTALAGSALGVLLVPSASAKRRDLLDVLRTGLTIYAVSASWNYLGLSTVVDPSSLASWARAFGLGLLYMAADLVGWTILEARVPGARTPRSLGSLLGLLGSVYLGQISAGVAIAVVQESLGVLAILSLVMLVLIMQHTFGLLLRVRSAYTMTVSALSRVAEMSQDIPPGHGQRVADLSAGIGRSLSLSPAVVERLTLAALLHDIGGVRGEPDAGRDSRTVERHQASTGATLISRVNFLSSLAPIIARHATPYSEYIETQDTDGLLARIIHVASDYDGTTDDSADQQDKAMRAMLAARGQEYDPHVVDAMLALVHKRGVS